MASGDDPPQPVEAAAGPRFLRLEDVAKDLSISNAQAYALVRSGDLPAIKVGGRGQWRVERTTLEGFISRLYKETAEFVREHPFGSAADPELDPDADQPPDQTS